MFIRQSTSERLRAIRPGRPGSFSFEALAAEAGPAAMVIPMPTATWRKKSSTLMGGDQYEGQKQSGRL